MADAATALPDPTPPGMPATGAGGIARPGVPRRPNRARVARRLSVGSAVLILAAGYVHLCLYRRGYRFIPKIGVSFLIQAAASALLAVALLLRKGRVHLFRRTVSTAQLSRLAAVGLSLGTLAALGLAHTSKGLFHFHERGLQPAPQTLIAIVTESLAALLLIAAMFEGYVAARQPRVIPAVTSRADRAARHAA